MNSNVNTIKKVVISTIFFLMLVCISGKSNATSISITPSNPKVGDTITVTVSISNVNTASITANVSGAVSGTIKVVGGDLSGAPSSYSKSESFYCSKEGNVTVSVLESSSAVLNGNYVDVGASKTVNVTTNSSSSNNNSNNNNSNNSTNNANSNAVNNTTTKSNNANLKNLGITPNDFKGFKATTTLYNVKVPNNVDSVKVYATAQDSKAKVSGTGNQKLKIGENVLKVTVTAEDGTQKNYTINVTREEVSSQNEIENNEIEDNSQEEQDEPQEVSQVEGDLVKLEIEGFELNPEYSKDIYEYTLDINSDLTELNVIAEGASHAVEVEVVGNKDLKDGENVITILVYNTETKQNTTYQIIVNKMNVDLETLNTTLNDAIKKANLIRTIILGVIIFIIVGIVIFIVVRYKYKTKEDDEYEEIEEENRINLDNEEELFSRVNKENNINPKQDKREFEAQEENINIESKDNEETIDYNEYSKKPRRKGRHF